MYILHIICNLKKHYILTFYKNGRYKLIFFGEKYFMGLFNLIIFFIFNIYNVYILYIIYILHN